MPDLGESLSRRERDVLKAMVNGASNKEIAAELVISPNTVKVHVRNIFTKMGVSSRTEAVTMGMQQGLIEGLNGSAATANVDEPEIVVATPVEPEFEVSQAQSGFSAENPPLQPAATLTPETTSPPRRWPVFLAAIVLIALLAGLAYAFTREAPTIEVAPTPFENVELSERGWFRTRPLDTARTGQTLSGIGLTLYQIGGETANGISDSVHSFNPRERTWTELASKPTGVTNASTGQLLGQLFVVGGETADGPTKAVEAYSPTDNAWRTVASLPSALTSPLAIASSEHLYIFGGITENGQYSNQVFAYDPIADSWRPSSSMVQARAGAVGGLLGNDILVAGGEGDAGALAACQLFNILSETWSDCPPMIAARSGADAATLGGRLYVIGGNNDGDVHFGESYDSTEQRWEVVNVPLYDSAENLLTPAVAVAETSIYVVGGLQGSQLQDGVYFYRPLQNLYFLPNTSNSGGN